MTRDMDVNTVVIGAGQAGLATGYELSRRGTMFVILEANTRVGDVWRRRWDSLRLFTPARFSGLPGMPVSGPRNAQLGKDEFADYLEAYRARFELPVREGVRVGAVTGSRGTFLVTTDAGTLTARHVVMATGANSRPRIPSVAGELDSSILQLHSSEYLNPRAIPAGPVLVVGAGTSGAEIALELAQSHRTFLAGRPTPHVPDPVFALAGGAYWAFINTVLTVNTPIGRKVAAKFPERGGPLIRVSMKQVETAGVTLLPRITGAEDGMPLAGDAAIPVPATVVWATGFRPDLSILPQVPLDRFGLPITRRGIVESIPGLYFVGMPFQYALTSALIGGVGRDTAYVADQITSGAERRYASIAG
jgi:putative flavoprotein involved in K+ transport